MVAEAWQCAWSQRFGSTGMLPHRFRSLCVPTCSPGSPRTWRALAIGYFGTVVLAATHTAIVVCCSSSPSPSFTTGSSPWYSSSWLHHIQVPSNEARSPFRRVTSPSWCGYLRLGGSRAGSPRLFHISILFTFPRSLLRTSRWCMLSLIPKFAYLVLRNRVRKRLLHWMAVIGLSPLRSNCG